MKLVYTSNVIYSNWGMSGQLPSLGLCALPCTGTWWGCCHSWQVLKNKKITLIPSLIFLGHPNFVAECLQSIKAAELSAASSMDNKIIKPNPPSKNELVNNCIPMVVTVSLMNQTEMLHATCALHLFPVRSAHGFVAHGQLWIETNQLSCYTLKGNWEKPNHWQAECACSCWCTISEAISNLLFLLTWLNHAYGFRFVFLT